MLDEKRCMEIYEFYRKHSGMSEDELKCSDFRYDKSILDKAVQEFKLSAINIEKVLDMVRNSLLSR